MKPDRIAGVILSAGASRRMGHPKALLMYRGELFLDRLIRTFAAVCEPVIVVLGYDERRIRASLAQPGASRFVVNPQPERGMLSSMQCGLRALPDAATAAIFTPVDHAHVRPETVLAVAAAFREGGAPVVKPAYSGRGGHPVCIARAVIADVLALPAGAQARDAIRRYACRTIEAGDPAVVTDIDDPAAYAALEAAGA